MVNEELRKELKLLEEEEKARKEEIRLKAKIQELKDKNKKKSFLEKVWDKI